MERPLLQRQGEAQSFSQKHRIGPVRIDPFMSSTSFMPLADAKQTASPSLFPDRQAHHDGLPSGCGFRRKRINRPSPNASFAIIAGVLVTLIGAATLVGWWFHIDSLKVIIPGAIPLKPNAAAGLLLSGFTLIVLAGTTLTMSTRASAGVMALLVVLLGVLTLCEHSLSWNLHLDNLVFAAPPLSRLDLHPGRMHPVTAFGFALIGVALLIQAISKRWRFRVPLIAGISATAAFIGVLPLFGFLLEIIGGPRWNFMGMSLSGILGAVSFQMLGCGLVALLHRKGELEWSLDALTSAGFVVGILLTALTSGTGFNFARQMLETNTRVAHRQEVLKEIESAKKGAAELLNAERLFVILGKDEILDGRQNAKDGLSKDLFAIRQLVSGNNPQEERAVELQSLISQRLAWDQRVIVARQSQGLAAATEMVATATGIHLMEQIRALTNEMEKEEYRVLESDQKEVEKAAIGTFLVLPMGVFISAGVLSLAVFFLNTGVTERISIDKTLRESQAQLRTIVENLDQGVVVSDLDGRLLHWNAAALRLHGYTSGDEDRRIFTELSDTFSLTTLDGTPVPVEDWPLARILRGENFHDLELCVCRVGGDWQRIFAYGGTLVQDENGQPLMAIVTVNDITERKRAEETRARLAAIIETSEDAIISKTLQGQITSWNRGAEKLFGYSPQEAIGQSMLMIFPPERLKEESDILARTRQGQKVDHFETVRVTKNGKRIHVSVSISPILNEKGEVIGASKIARDITDRKKAEEKIQQLNVELEERVKQRTTELETANKELEAFSYSVSHDLRAPLRAVDGFSQAVLEDYGPKLPEGGRHYLERVRDGAQRMGALIDDLLTFSRLSRAPLSKQAIDTGQLVRDVITELRDQKQDRNLDLRVAELPPCHGDRALLKQVWLNLLSNALKYTSTREKAVIEVGSKSENGEVVWFVADNGVGFDMQYSNKLFGVFQRLHRTDEFEGTGVGLAIVQRIVHRHGGRVWANAALNQGATFSFTLGKDEES
jgi:PAS domain S-box-containing protein